MRLTVYFRTLQKRKDRYKMNKTVFKHKRWLSLFVCLAMTVSMLSGLTLTATALDVAVGNPTIKSMDQSHINEGYGGETDAVTLLAGNSDDLRGETLEETIAKYRSKYLMGVASDFCVYLKEDFIPTESDAEGRVAVGGNIDTTKMPWATNYSIGVGDYVTHTPLDDLLKIRKGAATVIIGGKLKGQLNDTYYKDGKKYEGETWAWDDSLQKNVQIAWDAEDKSSKKLVLNFNTLPSDYTDGYNLWDNIPNYLSKGAWQKIDQTQTYVVKLMDFDDSFNMLYQRSADIAETSKSSEKKAETDITYDEPSKTITFAYTGDSDEKKECVYFNLEGDDFTNFQNANTVKFVNIPELPEGAREVVENDGSKGSWKYAYIVVNVDKSGDVHISNPDFSNSWDSDKGGKDTHINGVYLSENNAPGSTSPLYNFSEATQVVLGNNFKGTIFAPHAHVTDEFTLFVENKLFEATGKTLDEIVPSNYGDDNSNRYRDIMSQYSNYRGHLSGALIANSFHGATEFGYRPYTGPASIEPDDPDGPDVPDVPDEPVTADVTISKRALGQGDELAGAELTVYVADESGNKTDDIAETVDGNPLTWTSSGEGAKTFNKLKPGTYVLVEESAPDGYAKAEEITFKIDEEGNVWVKTGEDTDENGGFVLKDDATVVMEDKEITVTISKKDLGQGNELAGATLTVYVTDENGNKTEEIAEENGEPLTWESGSTPKEIKKLKPGIYVLEETSAPDGYTKAEDITFKVDEDGNVWVKTGEDTDENGGFVPAEDAKVVMEDKEITVTISKKALGQGDELAGAELTVYVTDENGNKTEEVAKTVAGDSLTWTSGKSPKEFKKLKPGVYVLEEKSAPNGYDVAEDITFRIDEDGTVWVKTGKDTDENNGFVKAENATVVMEDAPTSLSTTPPTNAPTTPPTNAPTTAPTNAPTTPPTDAPTTSPTDAPTNAPTSTPGGGDNPNTTTAPTNAPTSTPGGNDNPNTTTAPTNAPTSTPGGSDNPNTTTAPTDAPASTSNPSAEPTQEPTTEATSAPAPVQPPARGVQGVTRPTAAPRQTTNPLETLNPDATPDVSGSPNPSESPNPDVTPSVSPTPGVDAERKDSLSTPNPDGSSSSDSSSGGANSSGGSSSHSGEDSITNSAEGAGSANANANSMFDENSSSIANEGTESTANHEYTTGPESNPTPRTGDNNMPWLWCILSAMFAAGALLSLKRSSSKQN